MKYVFDKDLGFEIPDYTNQEQSKKLKYVFDKDLGFEIPDYSKQEGGFWKSVSEVPGAVFRGAAGVPLETAELVARSARATLTEPQVEKPQSFLGNVAEVGKGMMSGISQIPGINKVAESVTTGTIEGIKKIRESVPFLFKQPETKFGQMVQSGVQSAGTSLGAPLVAGAINPALGAAMYLGGMPALYGLSEKDRFMEDVKSGINSRKDLSEDEKKSFIANSEKYAWAAGGIEGGVEALSNVFVGKLLNLFGIGKEVSELGKKPLRELLRQTPKELIGKFGAMLPEELATENVQEISENELKRAAINQGLKKGEDVSNIPSIGETSLMTSGSTAISTILTFGLGSAVTHQQRQQIKNGLISPTASDDARTKSVNNIYSELSNIDKKYADNWLLNAQKNIAEKKPPMSAEELNANYNKLIEESKAKEEIKQPTTPTVPTVWTKDWQEPKDGDVLTDNLEKKIDYENGKIYVRLKEGTPSGSQNKERVDGSQPPGQESGGTVSEGGASKEATQGSGIFQTQEGTINPNTVRELDKTGKLQGETDYSKYEEEFNKVVEEIKTPEIEKSPERPQYTEQERRIIKNSGDIAVNNLKQTESEENYNKYKDEVRTNTEIRVRKEIDQRYKAQHEVKTEELNPGVKINNIAYAKTVNDVSSMILKFLDSQVDMTEGMNHVVNELRRRNINAGQIKNIMVDAYDKIKPQLRKIADKEKAIVSQKETAIPNAIKTEEQKTEPTQTEKWVELPEGGIVPKGNDFKMEGGKLYIKKPLEVNAEPVVKGTPPTIEPAPPGIETPAINTTQKVKSIFTTSKGSKYSEYEDGTTIRDKAKRPEHGEDAGIKPKSDATYYLTEEQANILSEIQTKGGVKSQIEKVDDTHIGIKYTEGKDTGKFEKRTIINPSLEPEVGLIPLELWEGEQPHFGNKIIEVIPSGEVMPGAEHKETPTIKESLTVQPTGLPTGEVKGKPKPLNMAGEVRAEKETKTIVPPFESINPKVQEIFNNAWESKSIDAMTTLLHLDNKVSRAEFENRSGLKLPKTNKGTEQTIRDYFGKAQEIKPEILHDNVPITKPEAKEILKQSQMDYSPNAIKKHKKYLFEKIDDAIKDAPDYTPQEVTAYDIKQSGVNAIETSLEQSKKDVGFVTIDVPGDGKFQIINSKQALEKFKNDVVAKFPTTKSKLSIPKVEGTANLGKGAGYDMSLGQLYSTEGYFGDGNFLLKGEPSKIISISKSRNIIELPTGKIKYILSHEGKLLNSDKIAFRIDIKGDIQGESDSPIFQSNKESGLHIIADVFSGDKKVSINQKYYLHTNKLFPDATFKINILPNNQNSVYVYDKGELVGRIMGYEEEKININPEQPSTIKEGGVEYQAGSSERSTITSIITYKKEKDGTYAVYPEDKNGNSLERKFHILLNKYLGINSNSYSLEQLQKIFNSEIAEKIKNDEGVVLNKETGMKELSNIEYDLKEITKNQVPVKHNEAGQLLSNNGKISKLNLTQWREVRTDSFINWFADSIVVDKETKEPLVMYHKTRSTSEIKEFKRGAGIGTHFGTLGQAEEIRGEGGIYPVFLHIAKPIRLQDSLTIWEDPLHLIEAMMEKGALSPEQASDLLFKSGIVNKGGIYVWFRTKGDDIQPVIDYDKLEKNGGLKNLYGERRDKAFEKIKEYTKDMNYDGFVYLNIYEGKKGEDSYVVLDNTQIKPAVGITEQPSTTKEGGAEYQASKYKALADELGAMTYDKRPDALNKLSSKDLEALGKEIFVSRGSSSKEAYVNKIAAAIGNKKGYGILNPEEIKEQQFVSSPLYGKGIKEYGKTKESTTQTQGLQGVSGENISGRQLANKWEEESLSKYKGNTIRNKPENIPVIVVGEKNGEIQTYQTTLKDKQRAIDAMKAQGLDNITWRAEMPGELKTFTHENIQELYKELNKPKGGITLELGGFQSIYEAIEKSFKSGNIKTLNDNLIELGKKVYRQGATNYDKFINSMRNVLGDMWESLKHAMVQTWKAVKAFSKEEIGAVGDIESMRNEKAGKQTTPTEPEVKKEPTIEKPKTANAEQHLLEMPELVELVDMLEKGNYPMVKERLGKALGRFTGRGDVKSIKLLASLAENDIQARKTLTHEILHWIDYIPENTLKRGNILGHIASLVKYFKQSIDKVPTDVSKVITQEVRNEIRKEAGRLARAEGKQGKDIWTRTNELTRKLTEEKKKSIESYVVYRKDVIAELKNVIREYNRDLFPNDDAGTKALEEHIQYYFNQPKEMYAEAGGAFVLRPDLFTKYAPKTLKLAIGYMENKPQAVEIYREYHNRIKNWSQEQLLKHRAEEEAKAYKESEEAYRKPFDEANKVPFADKVKNIYTGLKREQIDKFMPFYDSIKDTAKRKSLRTIIGNWLYRYSTIQAYATDIQFRGGYADINKAGITDANLAAYTKYLRIANEKEVKFNPGGHTAETAKLQIEHIRKEMGDAKFKILVDSTEKFLDVRQQMIERLKKEKMLSTEDYKMMEDNRYYFTFDNVKYILRRNGHAISAKMYGRVGMLGNVGNAYTATIMKDFENIKMHLMNSAKRASVKALGDIATPANKKPVSLGKDKTYLVPVPSADRSLGLITYMEDGKIHGVYVPKIMADTFDVNPLYGNVFVKGLQKIASPFRELFTRKRPGFWAFNYARDVSSAVMVLPKANLTRFLPKMKTALPLAIKSMKGDMPYVNEMFRKGQVIAAADVTGDVSRLTQTQRTLFQRGLQAAPERNKALAAVEKFGTWLNFISDVTERTTKIASSLYLDEYFPNMPQDEKTRLIRMAGTPNILEKGELSPITNNLFLFLNTAIQGWRTQIEIARDNPKEFAWKTFKYAIVPKALMIAGITGAFGPWIKDLFKKVSIYDLTNYFTIPIGVTSTGKTVYFRMPQSEGNRFIGGMFMKTFLAIYNKQSPTKDIASLFDYTADQFPGFNPAISTALDLLSIARGHVPYDEWRNRPAISDRNVIEAKDLRTVGAYAKYFANQLGVAGIVYKFDTDNIGEIKTTIEKAVGYPIASDIIGRFIKVGDGHYGIENEQLMKGIEEEQTQTSRMHLDVKEALTKGLKGNQLTADDIDVLKSADPRYVKYKLKELIETQKSGNNALRRAIDNARSEKEKMIILRNYIESIQE